MAEISAPLTGTNYTVPNFNLFTFTVPNVSIPTIPSINFNVPNITLPTYTIPNLNTYDFTIPDLPAIYANYDPQLAAIQSGAYDLRIDLEALYYNYQIEIEDLTIAKTSATNSLAALITFKGQLDTKKNELVSAQTSLNNLKTQLDASNAAYQTAVNLVKADSIAYNTAQTSLAAARTTYNSDLATYNAAVASLATLNSQLNTSKTTYNSDLATYNAGVTALANSNAALTASKAVYNTNLAAYNSEAASLATLNTQLTAAKTTYNSNLATYNAAVASLSTLNNNLSASEAAYNSSLATYNANAASLATLNSQLSASQATYNNAKSIYDSNNAQLTLDRNALTTLQQTLQSDNFAYQSGLSIYGQNSLALSQLENNLSVSLANYNTAKDLFDSATGNLEEQQNQLATLKMMYASDLQDYNTRRDALIALERVISATREKYEQDRITLAELSASTAGTTQELSDMKADLDARRASYMQEYSQYNSDVQNLKADEARLATDKETIRLASLDIDAQKSAQETQFANLEISEETIRNRELDIVSKEIEISRFESTNSNTLSLLQARKVQLDNAEFDLNSQVATLRLQEENLYAGQQQYVLQANNLASQISGLSIETESLNTLQNELDARFSDLQTLNLEQSANAELLAITAENLAVAKVSYQASRGLLDAAILQYEKDLAAYELSKSALNQANLELSATNLNTSIGQTKQDGLGINDILKFISGLLAALLAGFKAFMSIFGLFGDKGGISFLTPPLPLGITQPTNVPPITVIGPGTGGTNWGGAVAFPWLAFALLGLWGVNQSLEKK